MQNLTIFISNHLALSIALLIVFVLVSIIEFIRARGRVFNLSPAQATLKINHEHAAVIDIRTNDVYRKGHIIDAHSTTSADLRENTNKLDKFRMRPIIIVCSTGVESQKIAAFMLKRGYNAYSLAGGMRAWIDADMPVIKE